MNGSSGALAPLAELLAAEASVKRLAALLAATGSASVFGAARPGAPAVAASLFTSASPVRCRQLLVVTAQPENAALWAEDLAPWLPAGVNAEVFPALENLPYERMSAEPTLMQQRQRVLDALVSGERLAVVAPVRALLQPLMDPIRYRASLRMLAVGSRFGGTGELAVWKNLGYQSASVVQEPGQFSRRGGIVDVYPAGAPWPLRIELLGAEIESLRQFDPATQRSVAALNSAVVGPLHPFTLPASESALSELSKLDRSACLPHVDQQWQEDLRNLAEAVLFDGVEFYTPYLVQPAVSLPSYLAEAGVVVIDGPEEQVETAHELTAQARDIYTELVGRGEIPAQLRFPLLHVDQVYADLTLLPHLRWLDRAETGAEDWSAGQVLRRSPSYAGSLKRFVQDCTELRGQQERVCLVSLQSPRLSELLADEGTPSVVSTALADVPERGSISAVHCQLSEGWYAPNAHLVIFTDNEVAGWSRPRRAARFHRPDREKFALDFAPGDYVVHIEYGIGRFEGVVRESTAKGEREYLDLQFAGTDRLKVPTDKLDRVTKYRGMGETSPTLSRLGTQEWTRTKARVKESVEAVARELLELYRYREKHSGHAFAPDNHWLKELEAAFPYEETPDQERAIQDVKGDMESAKPMDRLVCGDVGYGKTEVAIRAAFKAVMDGKQVAVLVPTTILAQQHFNTFTERMQAYPVRIGVLSRFHSKAEQGRVLEGVKQGTVDVVVGTHRLLQKDVSFKDLGLLIIDEEQRFGVKAKEQLKQFRRDVDVLTLTATPIPRSLHMALVQVRDLSVIATPPEGRLPIKTFLEPFDEYHIREAMLRELDRGGQVYFVHNKVQTIEAIAERLRDLAPSARIGVAHGQMTESLLEKMMFDFAAGRYDVLVCSTIIESGLDIPNVNTMFVNDAPTFGLAQLHQLRGRIGRGSRRGYAYLLYNPSARITRIAERRLKAIFESSDLGAGFQIAMIDLEIRGAGNLLGSAQHGQMVAVGFQLYATLLGEAVERQKGIAPTAGEEKPRASIAVPTDAYIPSFYVEDENQRLRLYQRLAACEVIADVLALQEEFRDRFGALPEATANLLTTARLRIKAGMLDISSVQLDDHMLTVRGTPGTVFDRIAAYSRYGREVRIDRGVLRLPASFLAKQPLEQTEEILDRALALLQHLPGEDRANGGGRDETAPAFSRRRFPVS